MRSMGNTLVGLCGMCLRGEPGVWLYGVVCGRCRVWHCAVCGVWCVVSCVGCGCVWGGGGGLECVWAVWGVCGVCVGCVWGGGGLLVANVWTSTNNCGMLVGLSSKIPPVPTGKPCVPMARHKF